MVTQQVIDLFITGGTIDKNYQETLGELVFTQSYIPEVLQQANSQLDIKVHTLMLKDSLEMSHTDRSAILQACIDSTAEQMVITHGTDTMVQTAQLLESAFTESRLVNKTIVLTGAMRPFKLGNSDASFNLASALMAAQLATPGVYIAMNGRLFTANNVNKNTQLGIFEDLDNKVN